MPVPYRPADFPQRPVLIAKPPTLVAVLLPFLVALVCVIVIDQLAKGAAESLIRPKTSWSGGPAERLPFLPGVFDWLWNVRPMPLIGRDFLVLVGSAVAFSVVSFFFCKLAPVSRWLIKIAFGMIVGVGLSNIADVLLFGGVRNFMVLGFDGPWGNNPMVGGVRPSFSTAAVLGWTGAILIIPGVFFAAKGEKPCRRG